ncbi:MAG: hypothetical protein C4538_06500 [Nitrospiraceae bacterium]|nr:MAG: hypothetical protein C4538_06500 [Nitrospiraceae bacterium]
MNTGKIEHILLISFCALIIIPLLYIYRFVDDNTFTSWRWVFSATILLRVFFLLLPAILCAYALSRHAFSGPSACIFLFVLSAASIIPLWQGPEAVIDASRYFVHAKSLKEYGAVYFIKEWGNSIHAWTDMPLVSFIYGLVFSWFGEARIYIQAFNTLLFALTSLLTFLIGKQLWDEDTGVHAGLLLLGIPYLITQVPLMLVDVPTMFFVTLSIYVFLNALDRGGFPWIAGSSLAIFLAVFSKYSTWLMLSVIPLITAVLIRRSPKKILVRALSVLLMSGILTALAVYFRYDLFQEQITLLTTYQWSGLSRWQEGFISTFLYQIHPFVTILALFGIYRAVRARNLRFLIAGWFVIFVVLLQIKRIRYILPLFPLFVLMASYGLGVIKDKGMTKFITLCIAASSLVIVYSAYLPFLNRTGMVNLKHAGHYLNTIDCEFVEVYALPQKSSSGSTFAVLPILDYYTEKNLIFPQKWPSRPVDSNTQKSSLRFTWEMERPYFYSQPETYNRCAVVIISSEALDNAPKETTGGASGTLIELKRFDLLSEMFKYQTVVTILGTDHLSQKGQ